MAEKQVGQDVQDTVIVGGGPAGATAALYAARAALKTLVLDKGLRTGALGLAGKVANYPGVPQVISGAELLSRIRNQAQQFGALFVQDRVVGIDLYGDVKAVWGRTGVYRGRTVVIATGSMGRAHTLPGEERLVGSGVAYCAVCEGPSFKGEEVAVVGDNEEAVREALILTRFAKRVHLLVEAPTLRAPDDLVAQVQQHSELIVHEAMRVVEVVGRQHVEGVRVARLVPGKSGDAGHTLAVSGVFLYLQGHEPVTDFLHRQLQTTVDSCVAVDEEMQTLVPGVFAAGDVLCRHAHQAVVAAAEGARAGMGVQRYLLGLGVMAPDWS